MKEPTEGPAAPRRFCALAYAARPSDVAQSREGIPVIVFLSSCDSEARILVNPDCKSIVPESEWSYFEDLLLDWKNRLGANSEALFQQLSSLSAGPLVAVDVDPNSTSGFLFDEILGTFEEI